MAVTQAAMAPTQRRFGVYPAYKPSGVEWLREIPAHWSLMRLKRIVEFRGGGTPSKANVEYWRGEIPWVSPKDMKVSVVSETEDKITAQAVRQSATKLVPAGAVLLVVRSGILVHSIPVAIAGRELTLNQDLKALLPTARVLPEYLLYLISGMQRQLLVEWKKEGATVESLELDLVRDTVTPLPSLPEQGAIAAFLDRKTARIDGLVAKKERLIELLQEQRTALVTRAVTKGLDPNVPMKDSGIESVGAIPAHWELKRLKFMLAAQLKYGANEAAELENPDLPRYVRITDIDESDRLRNETFKSLPSDVAQQYLLRVGDLLFARSGATAGKTFLYRSSWGVCAYAGYLVRARLDTEMACPEFVRYFTASSSYWQWLSATFIQATIQNVSADKYASLVVPQPALQEQRAIAAFLDRETARIDALLAKVREAIDRLKEFRTALISAAVTGKIDLREIA